VRCLTAIGATRLGGNGGVKTRWFEVVQGSSKYPNSGRLSSLRCFSWARCCASNPSAA